MHRRQNKPGSVKAVSPRHSDLCTAQLLFQLLRLDSHKDNVRCTAVGEQLEAKEVQLAQPSSTSLLMISSGQISLKVQLHLPPLRYLDLAWNLARKWGERVIIYLSLHCHHQNDSCIKMAIVIRPFLLFHYCEGQSHKTAHRPHFF